MLPKRSHPRRRVYLSEALTLDVRTRGRTLSTAVIDVARDGLGVAVTGAPGLMPAVGDTVCVGEQEAVVRHVGRLRSGGRVLPRLGLELVAGDERCAGFFCPLLWFPLFAAGLVNLVMSIIAALEANKGRMYRYPFAIRLVR